MCIIFRAIMDIVLQFHNRLKLEMVFLGFHCYRKAVGRYNWGSCWEVENRRLTFVPSLAQLPLKHPFIQQVLSNSLQSNESTWYLCVSVCVCHCHSDTWYRGRMSHLGLNTNINSIPPWLFVSVSAVTWAWVLSDYMWMELTKGPNNNWPAE